MNIFEVDPITSGRIPHIRTRPIKQQTLVSLFIPRRCWLAGENVCEVKSIHLEFQSAGRGVSNAI